MHPEKERLHLYLSGALGPIDHRRVEAHVNDCAECASVLTEMRAEDAALADALKLDAAERRWLDSLDLVAPVMAQIPAAPPTTPLLVLVVVLLSLAGYAGGSLWSTVTGLLPDPGVGSAVSLIRTAGPALLRLLLWLGRGGLLPVIWPVLVIGAGLGAWRAFFTKEARGHA